MTWKITRLRATDIANISPLATTAKRAALEQIEKPKAYWGYQPVKNALPKLLLAGAGLFGDLPAGNDEELINQIRKQCKSNLTQAKANVAVAKAIIEWRNVNNVRGIIVHPEPFRMTADTLNFCSDVAIVMDKTLFIINLDCCSNMNLKANGKEFMKSLIFHTARIGDLRDAKVALLRTPSVGKGKRKAIFEILDGNPKYSLDEIDNLASETYAIWELILRDRRSASANEASGEAGTLI